MVAILSIKGNFCVLKLYWKNNVFLKGLFDRNVYDLKWNWKFVLKEGCIMNSCFAFKSLCYGISSVERICEFPVDGVIYCWLIKLVTEYG